MSELKTRYITDTYLEYYTGKHDLAQIYLNLKSEADKVIAFLKDKANYNECAYKLKSEELADTCRFYEDELRHHKYKRCLDNAWGCQQRMELFHELVLEEARTIALPNEVALKEYRSKRERAAKWHKRWLELAEKFKPDSTLQQKD